MLIFGLKNCDTCRKAVKSLENAELIDVRTSPLDDQKLNTAWAQFGAALLNTRSTTWRGLSDQDRAREPLVLLRAHPALMKRPLIETDSGQLYLGWGADVKSALGVSD